MSFKKIYKLIGSCKILNILIRLDKVQSMGSKYIRPKKTSIKGIVLNLILYYNKKIITYKNKFIQIRSINTTIYNYNIKIK